jgi:hypothetical protein
MAIAPLYGSGQKKAQERALRRGRVMAEIVRSHYEKRELSNQKILANQIEDRHRVRPNPSALASDVKWLEKAKWIRKIRNSIELRRRDYQLLADSWCAKALFIAAELTDEERRFSVSAWQQECLKLFAGLGDLSLARGTEKCAEFLEEFSDCGYLHGDVTLSSSTGQFNVGQWNKDWFYLEIARNAHLHRPFDRRRRSPNRREDKNKPSR